YATLGSPRGLVSCCKTYHRAAVTAEVVSSSLVVPATYFQQLIEVPHFRAGIKKAQNRYRGVCPGSEDIDVAEGRISQTGNRTAVMQEVPDFDTAVSHHFKPSDAQWLPIHLHALS